MTDTNRNRPRPFSRKANRDILKTMLEETYSVVEIAEHFQLSIQGVHAAIRRFKKNGIL